MAKGTYQPRSMDPTKFKDFEIAKEAMKFLPGPDEWAAKLGLLQGLAGGALGLAILWAGLALLNQGVRDLAQAYGSSFQLAFLPGPEALMVLALSAFLGWAGALLSVSKYLR